jgi:hypothetical protein
MGEIGFRAADLGALRDQGLLLKRPSGCGDGELGSGHLRADVGERVLAEAVPLNSKLAARLARGFDKAHFQHHLLRREDLHRVDHVGGELARDCDRLVEGHGIRRAARQHDAPIDR